MATPWPQDEIWPTDYREHATNLSKYLQKALSAIDNGDGLPVASRGVRVALIGALTLIVKMQSTPDLGHVYEAVKNGQAEIKTAAENLAQHINSLKNDLNETNTQAQQTMEEVQRSSEITTDAKAAAKEATEIGKATMKMIRDMKLVSQQNQANAMPTYANVLARGGLAASMHNPQNQKASPVQTLREIIINIRDPVTIANIRMMSPRSLKSHVDLAIEQSSNEHIENIKVVSSNQLKSGDLSIKTATTADMVALRQFAEDWEQRIGNGATVRIPTYGVLVHGVRTSSMNMDNFELIRDGILQDNKPFIPNAEIKYIGWLTRSSSTKSASSVVVEFTRPEDANKVIDEGLIWQGEVFQCELYDRQCRVRQCFQCHKYGHIGTQCKATITCGYCAQDHATRDCPTKSDRNAPRKCAACNGPHEAWNNQCPTRKQEVNKAKAASKSRPRYHLELESFVARITTGIRTRDRQNESNPIARTGRPTLEPGRPRDANSSRSRSPTKKQQKRANSSNNQITPDDPRNEIVVNIGSQRPRRTLAPSRRVLETLDANRQITQQSQQMEYNVRKSKDTVMATLLRDPDIGRYDILAIQEPWKNPFDTTTHHPAKDQFHLCYPDKDRNFPARVCFFINKRLDHSRWHFREVSRDLCSLNLVLGTEEEQQIVIHNVYNPTKTATERGSTLPLLELAIERWSHHEQIIVGDFNLHHELWGGDRVQRADPDAAELTTIMEDYCLTSNLAPGTITYEERDGRTTIDLCLTTAGLVDRLIQCEIETDMDHDSDHLPITTSLDLNTVKMIAKPRRNWKALDEKTFTRVLQRELPPQRRSRTKTALDRHVEEVMAAITAAVDEAVPKTAPSPRSKPGWNEECAAALAESKRLRRRHSLYRTEETWEAYRAARNDKGRVIKKALRQNHREKVEEAAQSPATLWRLAKWARNRHSQTPNVTPALVNPATKQQAITPSEKAELLRKTFFPARASRVISGAYKAASIPALDVETYLLPVEQQIFKHNVDTLGRVGPAERRHTEEEARRNKKKSPRRAIEQAIRDRQGPDIRRQEHIAPYIVPPWWQGPQTFIETNTEEAQIKHEQIIQYEPDAVHIYTDGSGIGGHIGAAAVCTTTQETKSAYMGDDTTSTVYAGELQGISLALQIAQEDRSRGNSRSKVLIYTDNQAAIRSTAKPKAAEPQQLYPLRSTMKTWSHKETIMSWERDWISETRGRASFRHTPKPSRKVVDLHDGLSKKHSALLTQLRTEKIGLKDFLYNRKVPGISSNRCPCGSDRQTVAHVLLRCRQHRQLRDQELGRLRGRNNLRKLLNERKAAAKAIKFIELTQILGQFQDRDLNRQS
ncbi:hypothetical protein FOFC_21429 [Fusarium oxysporum]|nr:hypothetical protein FOFC_21429 [Fusarium oxysporum]